MCGVGFGPVQGPECREFASMLGSPTRLSKLCDGVVHSDKIHVPADNLLPQCNGEMVAAKCFVCGESTAGTIPAATGAKGNCLLSAHEKCFCVHQCYMVISQDEYVLPPRSISKSVYTPDGEDQAPPLP